MVKASAPRAAVPATIPSFAGGRWVGGGEGSALSHTSDLKIGTPVAPCQAPGMRGSVLGLVGPVLVYSDWVR